MTKGNKFDSLRFNEVLRYPALPRFHAPRRTRKDICNGALSDI